MIPAHLTILKNYIIADGTLNAKIDNSDGNTFIADQLSAIFSPDFTVWRTDISSKEIISAIVGSEFVALTALKQGLLMLLLVPGTINAASSNVQTDFSDIFSAGTTLTALSTLAKRNATIVEKILSTGTGTIGSPAIMGFEGRLSHNDVHAARIS
jgi:hypothetical protein